MLFDGLILAVAFISILLSINLVKGFGQGVLRKPFTYFAGSIVVLWMSLAFLFTASAQGVYRLTDVTMHIWVHLLVSLGLILFAVGAKVLNDIARSPGAHVSPSLKDRLTLYIPIIVSAAVFFVANPLEQYLAPFFVGSIVDVFGLHHFAAFLVSLVCVWYIWRARKNWGKMLSVGAMPFCLFLLLIGTQHFWETITESWKLVVLSADQIELVERFMLLPAFLMLGAALYRIRSYFQS